MYLILINALAQLINIRTNRAEKKKKKKNATATQPNESRSVVDFSVFIRTKIFVCALKNSFFIQKKKVMNLFSVSAIEVYRVSAHKLVHNDES